MGTGRRRGGAEGGRGRRRGSGSGDVHVLHRPITQEFPHQLTIKTRPWKPRKGNNVKPAPQRASRGGSRTTVADRFSVA